MDPYIAQGSLQLLYIQFECLQLSILLSQPQERWNYRFTQPCPTTFMPLTLISWALWIWHVASLRSTFLCELNQRLLFESSQQPVIHRFSFQLLYKSLQWHAPSEALEPSHFKTCVHDHAYHSLYVEAKRLLCGVGFPTEVSRSVDQSLWP